MLPNMSQSKGNQTMKFGQFIEGNKRNNFLQKSQSKLSRETSPRPLFVFKKAVYEIKTSDLQLRFNIFQ